MKRCYTMSVKSCFHIVVTSVSNTIAFVSTIRISQVFVFVLISPRSVTWVPQGGDDEEPGHWSTNFHWKKSLLRFALSLKAVCTHPIPQKVEKLRLNLCKPMLLPIYTFLSSCLHQQSKNGNFNTMQCSATLCKCCQGSNCSICWWAMSSTTQVALMSCIQSIERYWR